MNKKTINSILIILLLLIWGSVIYKYFGKTSTLVTEQVVNSNHLKPNLNYNIDKDTFKLSLEPRDPFKASKNKKTIVNASNSKKRQPINKTKKANVPWPIIEYYGFVKGKQNSTKKVLLKINSKLYRKREKETIEALTIRKAYSDSILISYNKEHKTFKRK
ncbi:hypothetical protein [uncultured Lacinutrix sp.]|uniref:hypothetical protein n=1 Tax=uncultured Lacinutrix sp. TaxID=574032 RepID=UPI002630080D|nr:hypothetical protein [uncultured Lacinutrix sp.]